jgi:AmmeMemoRadiSam system protein B/AmmeMemoRadiSam system protein A
MKDKRGLLISGLALLGGLVAGILIIPRLSTNKDGVSPSPSPQVRSISEQKEVRQPAAAGQFYPQNPNELNNQLDILLSKAEKLNAQGRLRILIVPHAGITYSGETAAWGFKQLEGSSYSRVILLGPSHKTAFAHAAIYPDGAWETPLGTVEIDDSAASMLLSKEQSIIADKAPHAEEHSLEVELIFLQKILKGFKIIPILVGQPSDTLIENLAQKINYLFDDKTLLVISTDLSHYPSWETANEVDRKTIEAILSGNKEVFENTIKDLESQNYPNLSTCACGYQSLRVALRMAELLSISDFKKIDYKNSGDVTNDQERVVGYAAIGAWSQELPSSELDSEAQKEALEIARKTLNEYIINKQIPPVTPESRVLHQPLGAFVTLRKSEQLRGCLGMFEPMLPLYQVIQDRTIAAATKDIRFVPVTANELSDIKIEISVLTPRQKIANWQEIEIGKHGVVVEKDTTSGTFLPQVATDNEWGKEKFLSELCTQKARLPVNCYQDPSVRLYVFEAQVFGE